MITINKAPRLGRNALWKAGGFPRTGWTYVCEVLDNGQTGLKCPVCDHALIRYVHILEHDNWHDNIAAGVVCAGHLTGDTKAAEAADALAKSLTTKRTRGAKAQAVHNANAFKGVPVPAWDDFVTNVERNRTGIYFKDGSGKWVVTAMNNGGGSRRIADGPSQEFPSVFDAVCDTFKLLQRNGVLV